MLVPVFAVAEDRSSQLNSLVQQYHDLEQFNGAAVVIDSGSQILRGTKFHI